MEIQQSAFFNTMQTATAQLSLVVKLRHYCQRLVASDSQKVDAHLRLLCPESAVSQSRHAWHVVDCWSFISLRVMVTSIGLPLDRH